MAKRAGFTIVEIVIVMVIMAVLLTLGVVGLAATQVNGRDAKRKADVEAIARGLEGRFKLGNPKVTSPTLAPGTYPATAEFLHSLGLTQSSLTPDTIPGGYVSDLYPGTTNSNFTSPKSSGVNVSLINFFCIANGAAENMTTITGCINSNPDAYYYESINANGDICNGTEACVRYNLYYKLEKDGSIVTVRSERQ